MQEAFSASHIPLCGKKKPLRHFMRETLSFLRTEREPDQYGLTTRDGEELNAIAGESVNKGTLPSTKEDMEVIARATRRRASLPILLVSQLTRTAACRRPGWGIDLNPTLICQSYYGRDHMSV